MSQWSYKLDDQQLGPVSFQELAALVRDRKVSEGTQVCRAGTADWQPAWHVPGLFRAAGIVEAGDSPLPVTPQIALAPAVSQWESETRPIQNPKSKIQNLVRGLMATVVGVLAVGFFYRWASHAALAFPMPPVEVDGETIDCYFPLVGRCTVLECALLYVDVFWVAAVATWHAAWRKWVVASG